ncbi:MAG: serine hydrolase [Acidobacteriota bacterium]
MQQNHDSQPTGRLGFLIAAIVLGMGFTTAAHANNGVISYAYPVTGITVDGDLSDWSAFWEPTILHDDEEPEGAADFSAWFRAGYHLESRSLYLAVEVRDQSHRIDDSEGATWESQDTHLLYLDARHEPSGSGNTLWMAGESFREIEAPLPAWDPGIGTPSWRNAEVAVRRAGDRTFYEWRLHLGKLIRPNRTLGLDHLFADVDAEDTDSSLYIWGPGLGKSANSHRLGDLVLLADGARLSELRGQVRWSDSEQPLPPRVRIRSQNHPELSVQTTLDAAGRYSVRLPPGSYSISAAHGVSKPFGSGADDLPAHFDADTAVEATVRPGRVAAAPPLVLNALQRPDFLFRSHGVLYDFDPAASRTVDTFLDAFRQYYRVPGVSVALVKQGQIVYRRSYGIRNRRTGAPVESSTLFEAASISKPVFAFLAMRLAERGILDLDVPLHRALEFPNIAGDERSKNLTARHILTHQSGLPNWAWGGPGGWESGGPLELNFAPGTRFDYSGEAFNYLGRVLEAITGKDLETLFQEEVFGPLGMINSDFALDRGQSTTAAMGHIVELPVLRQRADFPSPASSLHTTAEDFSRFMIGVAEGRGLKPETYREMLSPRVEVPVEQRVYRNPWAQSISHGFFVQETPHGPLVEHGGNNGDFHCKFGLFTDSGDGYVIFTNSNQGDELMRAFEVFLLHGRP